MKKKIEFNCVILGGGGHASVLIDCILSSGKIKITGVLDINRSLWGKKLSGIPILGDERLLPKMISRGVNSFVVGVGSVGDCEIRRRLFGIGLKYSLKPVTVIHSSAIISRGAELGPGSQVLPGAIVNTGVKIGANSIINSGAIIEHDCVIGPYVHVASGAKLASAVHVGEGAHIGSGASVRQGIRIGANAMVGMGAVVVKDVPKETTVAGVPARALKK
jgi:sugar O-acyltransferase (sialic acid O-acetyltransferase NeuD family)